MADEKSLSKIPIEERRAWAEIFPTEDSYGSIIVGWLIDHSELFETDWRLENAAILHLSPGWKALVMLAARHLSENKGGLTAEMLKRIVSGSKATFGLRDQLLKLVDWAKASAENATRDDYEEAMRDAWLQTRKDEVAAGMTAATRRMYVRNDFEAGLDDALETISKARDMAQARSAGAQTMARLSAQTPSDYDAPQGVPMRTGFIRVDMETQGGIRKGNLWLLVGSVSQGKSAMAKEIAYTSARDGRNVFYVSMEMTTKEIRTLFEVRHSHTVRPGGVSLSDATAGTLDGEERDAYFEAARQWAGSGIGDNVTVWVPSDDVTADDVVRRVEVAHRKRPVDLLVVDYSELLVPVRRRQQYRIELGDTIRRFKTASQSLGGGDGVATLLLHQVSRKGYEKACKRGFYVMSDLAETAQAERHPNVIMWVLQTEDMVREHEICIGIAKNRMGPKGLLRGYMICERFDRSLLTDLAVPSSSY